MCVACFVCDDCVTLCVLCLRVWFLCQRVFVCLVSMNISVWLVCAMLRDTACFVYLGLCWRCLRCACLRACVFLLYNCVYGGGFCVWCII